jgi:hypothetical protein
MNSYTFQIGDKKTLRVDAFDVDGNPTTNLGGGTPVWATSDPAAISLTPIEGDPLHCGIEILGAGEFQVTVTETQTDGDVIAGLLDAIVLGKEATVFNIVVEG